MKEFWATRSGRWRLRLQQDTEGTLEERLCQLIFFDIGEGLLPAGAIMPSPRKVAAELGIEEAAVAAAYQILQDDGFLALQADKGLCIASPGGDEPDIGVDTQVLFEQNLLNTARRAMAEGVSTRDASGVSRSPRAPKDPDDTTS
jgi:DNA-binding transcriptional regulator YhcF (GntR family)